MALRRRQDLHALDDDGIDCRLSVLRMLPHLACLLAGLCVVLVGHFSPFHVLFDNRSSRTLSVYLDCWLRFLVPTKPLR